MSTLKKYDLLVLSILVLSFCFIKNQAQTKSLSEPVPGAEILIEHETDGVKIAKLITDKSGEFSFSFPTGFIIPKSGRLTLSIIPPKINLASNKKLAGMVPQKISVKFTSDKGVIDAYCTSAGGPYAHAISKEDVVVKGTSKTIILKFILIWSSPDPVKSNQGGFAVSGRNNS